MRRAAALLAGALSALGVAGCSSAPLPAARPATRVAGARYEVRVAASQPWVLAVELTVAGGASQLVAGEAALAVQAVEVTVGAQTRTPERVGASFRLDCPSGCTVRYRIDLSEAARASGDDPAVALRSGADIVAPASTWLLRPEPLTAHVPIEVVVHDAAGVGFASGFAARRACAPAGAPLPDAAADCSRRTVFGILSQELRTAGFTAFGAFAPLRARVDVRGAGPPLGAGPEPPARQGAVDIAVLGGGLDVGDAAVVRWVERMADTVSPLFGRFPVARTQLVIVPQPGETEPTWGRTLPSGGPSILMTVGAKASEEDLAADWILVHEMIHLGVPSFWREGRWLDEGLATYYEPVLRTRAGLLSERELWSEFAARMPRGLGEPGDPGLVGATLHARVYWGGAAFVLRADSMIRSRTGGTRSLDDGLRAVLARGADATRIWSLDGYLRAIDEAVEVPVMRELYAAVAEASVPACASAAQTALPWSLLAVPRRGPPCSSPEAEALADLLRALGVVRGASGAIVLDEDAPLSAVRRAIGRGDRRAVPRAL